MRAVVDGEEEAFRLLFDRHSKAVRAFLVRKVGADSADDVVVETFAVAWVNRRRFDQKRESARPWLMGIAVTLSKKHGERDRRWYGRLLHRGERSSDPDLGAGIMSPDLRRAFEALPTGERDVLGLVALGELTIVEAARALQITDMAARTRLKRARARIVASLEAERG